MAPTASPTRSPSREARTPNDAHREVLSGVRGLALGGRATDQPREHFSRQDSHRSSERGAPGTAVSWAATHECGDSRPSKWTTNRSSNLYGQGAGRRPSFGTRARGLRIPEARVAGYLDQHPRVRTRRHRTIRQTSVRPTPSRTDPKPAPGVWSETPTGALSPPSRSPARRQPGRGGARNQAIGATVRSRFTWGTPPRGRRVRAAWPA
jgi:hypothetical protein